MNKNIPEFSLQRLPIYLNFLRAMPEGTNEYISSGAIAKALDMGEVLVRKDLAYTSAVGRPKVGYVRKELIAALEEYLNCHNRKNAVIVGVGGLGRAILSHGGFVNYGIEIVAAFDNDPEKIGTQMAGKPVFSVDALSVSTLQGSQMAVICVPAEVAQTICDKLVACGVTAILNFAPVMLKVPSSVKVRYIDVAANLAVLASTLS
jgi:redox-sensing transcriptional repressor